jgi:hypothetical protein
MACALGAETPLVNLHVTLLPPLRGATDYRAKRRVSSSDSTSSRSTDSPVLVPEQAYSRPVRVLRAENGLPPR